MIHLVHSPNIVELDKWRWPAFCAVGLYGAIAVIIPLGSIVLTSFLKSMSKPITWSNIGIDPWIPVITSAQYMESVWNSVIYGVIAATIGTYINRIVVTARLVDVRESGDQLVFAARMDADVSASQAE